MLEHNMQMVSDDCLLVQQLAPESQMPHKKPRKKYIKKEVIEEGRNVGHWTREEKLSYYLFLEKHRKHFYNSELRRTDKIFKEMAKELATRAADQCRSHHQKMEKKYSNFHNILSALREEYSQVYNVETFGKDQEINSQSSTLAQDCEGALDFHKIPFSNDDHKFDLFAETERQLEMAEWSKNYQTSTILSFQSTTESPNGAYDIVDAYLN